MDRADGRLRRRISGQLFHFAGSSSDLVPLEVLQYTHKLVARMTGSLVSEGGRVVIQLGEEPRANGTQLSKLFDWTILEEVVSTASRGNLPHKSVQGTLCIAV